jgi:putative ABC transport system permease protein
MHHTLRAALRTMRIRRAYTVLAVATIALGIGAAVTAWSVANTVLFAPLPYPESERLVWIGQAAQDDPETGSSFRALTRWRDQSTLLERVGGFTSRDMRLTSGANAEQLRGTLVSGDFFGTLGVQPLLGRVIATEDDQLNAPAVAVISFGLWQSRYGGRQDVIGSIISLDDKPHVTIGVMPAGFSFPSEETSAWIPALAHLQAFESADGAGLLLAIGRLRPTADMRACERELRAIESQSVTGTVDERGYRPFVRGLREHLTRELRPRVHVLLTAAALMMLLACANLLTMLLTQVIRRSQEVAMRRALGASTLSITRQLMTEHAIALSLGTISGLVVAVTILRLAGVYKSEQLPELSATTIGLPGALAAVGLSVFTMLALGGVSTLQLRHVDASRLFKDGTGPSASRAGSRVRDALITSQIALTVLMVGSAATLAKSYLAMSTDRNGMVAEGVFIGSLSRPHAVMTPVERPHVRSFMMSYLDLLGEAPTPLSVAISTEAPGGGNQIVTLASPEGAAAGTRVGVQSVSEDYFTTLRIPIRAGRAFERADRTGVDEEPVPIGVIDESLSRRLFGTESAIGRVVVLKDLALSIRVVGVCGDVRQGGPTSSTAPQVYLPYDVLPLPWVSVLVRSSSPAPAVLATLRSAAFRLDPEQPIANFVRLSDRLSDNLDRSRFYTVLLGSFAVCSLLLTAVGLYGVVSLLVAQRQREFGIRLSVGATPQQVQSEVLLQSLRVASAGLAIGVGLAFMSGRAMRALLYGMNPTDPLVLGGATLVVGAAAVLAALGPARSASRLDPARIMRVGA